MNEKNIVDPIEKNDIEIKIDEIEKNNIENYDEFIKYINELKIIDEFDIDDINYNINDDDIELNDELLLSNFKKIFENTIIKNDIELYYDIDEFIDEYINFNSFKNYEFEINNKKLLFIDNKYKIIKNIDVNELYDIVKKYIINSLDLYNKVNYEKIVEIFNVIKKYNEKIYVDDPIDEIYYDIFDNDIDEFKNFILRNEKNINSYDNSIEFFYVNNITSSNKLYIEIIKYENINEIFDDDVVDDLINYLSSIYYYYYNEINKLNEILDI